MKFSYTSIDRIFTKFERDLGKDFNEDDIIEWSGEALDFIGAVQAEEDAIAFIEVKNHQCEMPKGVHIIQEIARNNNWSPEVNMGICPSKIITAVPATNTSTSPAIPVALDCNGTPINDYELAYYRPYFDIRRDFGIWFSSDYYRENYSPMFPSNSKLYDSLVCQGDLHHRHGGQYDTYQIIQKKIIRVPFLEGSIAIAYTRQLMDEETGYPMIPDDISYTTAIVKYINFKMCERDFYNNRQGSESRMAKSEEQWTKYCGQAGNKAMMPNGEAEFQELLESRQYLIPLQRFYSYFGNNNSRRGYHVTNSNHNYR